MAGAIAFEQSGPLSFRGSQGSWFRPKTASERSKMVRTAWWLSRAVEPAHLGAAMYENLLGTRAGSDGLISIDRAVPSSGNANDERSSIRAPKFQICWLE